jgi:uncharacterized membrane protein
LPSSGHSDRCLDQLRSALHAISQIFFTGNTWLFYVSDNLIRLFPPQFWQDIFDFIGGCATIFCLILIVLFFRKLFPKARLGSSR